MQINVDVVSTIYDDAALQLLKYGKTVEEKLEDILEDYASEYRSLEIRKEIESDIEDRIKKNDFRKDRNI